MIDSLKEKQKAEEPQSPDHKQVRSDAFLRHRASGWRRIHEQWVFFFTAHTPVTRHCQNIPITHEHLEHVWCDTLYSTRHQQENQTCIMLIKQFLHFLSHLLFSVEPTFRNRLVTHLKLLQTMFNQMLRLCCTTRSGIFLNFVCSSTTGTISVINP